MIVLIMAITNDDEREVALELWNTYKNKMYQLAYSILKNKEDAEDAVNDTFCRIIKHIDKFYGEKATNVKSLIMIYTRGTCINNYNKIKNNTLNTTSMYNKEGDVIDIPDNTILEPDAIVDCKDTSDILNKCLNSLSDKYRDVLILKYYHGLKDSEIAEALGITVSNADVRVHRAKKYLADTIKKNNCI